MAYYLKGLKISERKKYKKILSLNPDTEKLVDWKDSPIFRDNLDLWGQKLKTIRLNENELMHFLGEPGLKETRFESYFPNYESISAKDTPFFSENFTNIPLAKFFDLFNDQILSAQQKLNSKLHTSIKDSHFDILNSLNLLSYNIADKIFDIISRTLVLEMNVERLKGGLKGENSAERFSHFVTRLKTEEVKKTLFDEYQVLYRQVNEFLEKWVYNSYELISRLAKDWGDICAKFALDPKTDLAKIQINAGDLHDHGKSVTILHFANSKKIVYKPRNLEVDTHLQELLHFYNKTNIKLKFRPLLIINKEKYGWVEFIENEACNSPEEIENYYTRLGYTIFVLYSLNATDFHHENIIACGEFPVLIDLETLFNPYLAPSNYRKNSSSAKIFDYISNSVLATALLPWKSNMKGKFVDISGMTDVSENNPEMPKTAWDSEATDSMSITRKMVKFAPSPNTPKTKDDKIDPFQYYNFIVSGFDEISKIVVQNKDKLIGDKGLLQIFKNNQIRILFRQTQEYAQLINASFHPDFLRDAIEREILFDYLWIQVTSNPLLRKIVDSEQESLHNMDVPLFKCRVDGTALMDTFEKSYPRFFKKSGYDIVVEKIRKLSTEEIEKQKWLIKASIEPYIKPTGTRLNYLYKDDNILEKECLVNLSLELFEKLKTDSWELKNDINWLGIYSDIASSSSNISPLQMDLYLGKPGVILYLAYLWKITKNKQVKSVFSKLINTFKDDVLHIDPEILSSMGIFNGGLSGLIYLYAHLSYVLEDEYYSNEALKMTDDIDAEILHLSNDIIDGKAGVVLALISLYSIKKEKKILKKIKKIGKLICEESVEKENGIGWKDATGKLLSGFAHGVSGISYALSEIYKLTEDEYYIYFIKESVRYENSLYVSGLNNWLDLRDFEQEKYKSDEMTAWCNGAVGIGLNRVFLSKLFPDEARYEEDARIAVSKTIQDGFGRNHTLCHGDLGNLDFLMLAKENFNDPGLENHFKKIATLVCSCIKNEGGICSTVTGLPTYGLMTGISGMGLQLLRIAYPDFVPSILILEPPKITR